MGLTFPNPLFSITQPVYLTSTESPLSTVCTGREWYGDTGQTRLCFITTVHVLYSHDLLRISSVRFGMLLACKYLFTKLYSGAIELWCIRLTCPSPTTRSCLMRERLLPEVTALQTATWCVSACVCVRWRDLPDSCHGYLFGQFRGIIICREQERPGLSLVVIETSIVIGLNLKTQDNNENK